MAVWAIGDIQGCFDAFEALMKKINFDPEVDTLWGKVAELVDQMFSILVGNPRSQYLRCFVVSIILISAISWVLVEGGITLANAVGVPPVIVALTILAPGTSVPDMISSVVVAKQGRGGMAVANAVATLESP